MRFLIVCAGLALMGYHSSVSAAEFFIADVPDYDWHAGCFGTATGNLMGYWDRNGLPNFYAGPTGGGVAPLRATAGSGVTSMWVTKAGVDGRPFDKPGHMDDYYVSYESTAQDPYMTLGRAEHEPDCIGDFIGLNQRKWTNLNNECDGNIDAYSFVYWDASGDRRTNYIPPASAGPPVDIQSGLRKWCEWRGYEADVYTQLLEFNPETPAGHGFTWEDLKAEIHRGYPVLVFLQPYDEKYRSLSPPGQPAMPKANPEIHGMLMIGYRETASVRMVRCRTSWGIGENQFASWNSGNWNQAPFPARGVIGFRPHPKVTRIVRQDGQISLSWDGPSTRLVQVITSQPSVTNSIHSYTVERSTTLNPEDFVPVGTPTTERTITLDDDGESAFYRVRLDGQ